MGRIKSAWEIALERTEAISIDKDKLEYNDNVLKARTICSLYINDEEQTFEQAIEKLKAITDTKALYQGAVLTTLQNFNLPTTELVDNRATRAKQLIDYLAQNQPQVVDLTGQIVAFLKQYPEHKKQLIEQLKAQAEPTLREKEAKLQETYGEEVHLTLEQDKDFLQIANQNLDKLSEQYNQTLEGAKAQLKGFFKL